MELENLNVDEIIENSNVSVDDVIDAATNLASSEVIKGNIPKNAGKYALAVAGGIAVGVVTAEVIIPKFKEKLPEPKRGHREDDIIEVEAEELKDVDVDEGESSDKDKKKDKKK